MARLPVMSWIGMTSIGLDDGHDRVVKCRQTLNAVQKEKGAQKVMGVMILVKSS